jgi:hypothetical protein
MENNWFVEQPTELRAWQPKFNIIEHSSPYSTDCQINATHDIEAIKIWIGQYQDNSTTMRAYQKEAERLLLWCVYERGLCLKELKTPDLEDFFNFLQRPPKRWLGSRRQLAEARFSKNWRPLLGPLKKNSLLFAIRVINSLMNYLVDANYLPRNPIKLIKKYSKLAVNHDEQKYQVWAKMLELDEWLAVQIAIFIRPKSA